MCVRAKHFAASIIERPTCRDLFDAMYFDSSRMYVDCHSSRTKPCPSGSLHNVSTNVASSARIPSKKTKIRAHPFLLVGLTKNDSTIITHPIAVAEGVGPNE